MSIRLGCSADTKYAGAKPQQGGITHRKYTVWWWLHDTFRITDPLWEENIPVISHIALAAATVGGYVYDTYRYDC